MDAHEQLSALMELAESFGIGIRFIRSGGENQAHSGGGLVKLKGREIIFLDTAASLGDQASVIASALIGIKELENRFLLPEIRKILDEASHKRRQ